MPDPETPRMFRAFISYRHADNAEEGRRWAHWLHNELERYQVPRDLIGKSNAFGESIPEHLYPIFRDEEEMRAGDDLSELINYGLQRSEWLIVLCSPRSAASRYVRSEIAQFKLLGKTDRILPVIVEGDPGVADSAHAGGNIAPVAECFPRPLRRGVAVPGKQDYRGRALIDWRKRPELLAADLRPEGTHDQGYTSAAAYRTALEKRNGTLSGPEQKSSRQLRDAERRYADQLKQRKLKIIAGLLGVDLGELTRRDAAARARRLKRLLGMSVAMMLLVAGLAVLAIYQQRKASSQLAASRYTLANIESEEHADPAKALLLACEAAEAAPRSDQFLDAYVRRAEMLALACPRQIKVADKVDVAVFSPGLDKVATLSDGCVQITDLRSGENIRVPSLTEPEPTVASFTVPAFSPDGSLFLAGTGTNTARYWKLSNGRSVQLKTPEIHAFGSIQSQFYFSPNGRTALGWVGVETGDFDGQHEEGAWNVESGVPASTAALSDVFRFGEQTWSRNRKRNWGVTLPGKHTMRVIDVSNGISVSPDFGPEGDAEIVSLGLSPDAEWLVTVARVGGEEDFELRLWSAKDGKPADVTPMHSGTALRIQDVSRDGRKVLTIAERDQDAVSLQLWEFGRDSYPHPYRELGMLPNPDSSWARVWSRGPPALFCGETGLVAAAVAEPTLAWGSGPHIRSRFSIRLWHVETGRELSRSIQSAGGLAGWTVSDDGRRIATATADGVIAITNLFWHESTGSTVSKPHPGPSPLHRVERAWFAPKLDSVVTATSKGIEYAGGMPTSAGNPKLTLMRWRLPELQPIWSKPVQLTGDPMALSSPTLGFSPDGKQIVVGAVDVRLLDMATGEQLGNPYTTPGRHRNLAFLRDSQEIAFASEIQTIEGKTMLRIEERPLKSHHQPERIIEIPWHYANDCAFTRDGQHILTVFRPDNTGRERLMLRDWTNSIEFDVKYTRDSPTPRALTIAVIQAAQNLVSVSSKELLAYLPGASVRIHAVPAGVRLEHKEAGRAIIAPAGPFEPSFTPTISADARWIATATPGAREIRVWSALTGMPSSEPIVRRSEVVAMYFDPAAEYLWHVGRDGEVQATYVGEHRLNKPQWLDCAGPALTGIRPTGRGLEVEWLDGQERHDSRVRLWKALTREAARTHPQVARIVERLEEKASR